MKLTADQGALAAAIAWAAQALPRKPVMPAMAGLLLTAADDGTLTIRAFDGDTSHTVAVPTVVAEPGEVLASGWFLRSITPALKAGPVNLEADGSAVTLSSGRSRYGSRAFVTDDWPKPPELPADLGSGEPVADAETLRALVSAVAAPVDDSDPGPVAGVRLEGHADALRVIGMSRSVVHVAEHPALSPVLAVTVPLGGLTAALAGMSGPVWLAEDRGLIGVRDESRVVTLRTYATDYPKYEAVLRDTSDEAATCDAAELREALRRAGLVLSDPNLAVVLSATADEIEVRAIDEGTVTSGVEYVAAEVTAPFRVGLRAGYLADALAACSGPVTLGHSGRKPIMVRPADAEAGSFVAAVAPMKLPAHLEDVA